MVTKGFRIIYAPGVSDHLKKIDRKYYSIIRETIAEQLRNEPHVNSTNRKPLKFASQYGEWELRFGPKNRFRIVFRFSIEAREVYIGAIGEKIGSRLFIGGEEVKL